MQCQTKIIRTHPRASAHEIDSVVQQSEASFIPRAAVRGRLGPGLIYLAEAEALVHCRNGRTVLVQFCWLCYSPTEVLINANC